MEIDRQRQVHRARSQPGRPARLRRLRAGLRFAGQPSPHADIERWNEADDITAAGQSRRGHTRRDTLRFGCCSRSRLSPIRFPRRWPPGHEPRPRTRADPAAPRRRLRVVSPITGEARGAAGAGHLRGIDDAAVHAYQDQPWSQPLVPSRRSRREQPWEVRRVELDRRQVVRLDVAAVRSRIGANDQLRVDAEYIAGPVERQVHRRQPDAGNGQADGEGGSFRKRPAVGGVGAPACAANPRRVHGRNRYSATWPRPLSPPRRPRPAARRRSFRA